MIELSREAEDLLLAALGKLTKPQFGGKKNNNVVKAVVPSKGHSRFDNPTDHQEGGPKKSKKERDAAASDAINAMRGAVGWPGSSLNTVRPMSSVR